LNLVGLKNTENRYPSQLSGGEQQRVALARVIVMEPKLLLMDEPLSNLDAKLRIHMRTEIRRIQKKLGITCLYVTHDQSEALTMADRIVVMNHGKVEQVGTPLEIYSNPQSIFVADFIGQANIIKLEVSQIRDKDVSVILPHGGPFTTRAVFPEGVGDTVYAVGGKTALIARPESISILSEDDPQGNAPATVVSEIFVGSYIEYEVELGDHRPIKAFTPFQRGMRIFKEGERVSIHIDPSNALFLPL
jgi:iron(III) transport system ATP-binding protein